MQVRWVAKYSDGSVVHQYADGVERSYDTLPDRDRITAFAVYDQETRKSILTLHLDPGQKLIYRRRVEMKSDRTVPVEVCYLVGWRRTISGECVQSIAYIFETSGRIELAGRFDESHPWFYSPVLRPFEA